MLTHVASWEEAIHGLLVALDGRRAGRRVVGVAALELVLDADGVVSIVIEHAVRTDFAAAPGSVLRAFGRACNEAADEQEGAVQ
jgi:hypothetical protein